MKTWLSPAQERGLIILIAIALVTTGIVIFLPSLKPHRLDPLQPIELDFVNVLIPTFYDQEPSQNIVLNTAPLEDLIKLPGIGAVLGQRIIAYREEHGPFKALTDLKKVSGIGESIITRIQDLVTLD